MLKGYRLRDYDFKLVIMVLALSIIGYLAVGSAKEALQEKQMFGIIAGFVLMIGLSLFDYKLLLKLYWFMYIGNIVLLVLVQAIGKEAGGAQRWLEVGSFTFQPSETAKILLILFFAQFIMVHRERFNTFPIIALCVVLIMIPLILIVTQPDLSTSIVIMVFILCLIYIAGISYKWIIGALSVGVPGIALIVYLAQHNMVPFLRPYQVNRILAFINPEKYADLDLQQKNSEMAIGSGQLYGKGLFNDTAISVKNGNFLSEEHTDFIFSVIGEELGFVGCMIVLLLYLWFIYECLRMAGKARDMSGKLICTGMAALVGFQAFTNIAVATGVFPNTGLPLPFISYGVSSLVSLYIGVGLVLNVGLQPSKLGF